MRLRQGEGSGAHRTVVAVIGMVLAAGVGRRLRPHTDHLPKALIPVVGDRTILDIALANLASVGIEEAVIVVGYAAEAVRQRKGALERRYGIDLTLVDNDKAEEWNNAYSLWTARDLMADGVLMLNGDTVHPVAVEEVLLSSRGPGILLALDAAKTLAEEEMKVRVDPAGAVLRITKAMDPAEASGEYIGATLIEPEAVPQLIDALEATWRRDPNLYYEDAYQEMVDRGDVVMTAEIPAGTAWVEVDDQVDLARAREIACRY
jgi:choline kinase